MRDRNHAYHSDSKTEHRNRVRSHHTRRFRKHGVCVTLASCHNGDGSTHPSYDVQQWASAFDSFIGVNRDAIGRTFRRYHAGASFVQGDAFETFAALAMFRPGLYYLDSINTMQRVATDKRIRKHLAAFLTNAQPRTTLALNMAYNRRIIGELPDATRAAIRAKIRAVVGGLPLDGWEVSTQDFDTYQSTRHTRMVTVFFCRKA